MPENLCGSAFRLLSKWKKTIEEWNSEQKVKNENRESSSKRHWENKRRTSDHDHDHERDHDHTHRNFIKRTYDRSSENHRMARGEMNKYLDLLNILYLIKTDYRRDSQSYERRRPRNVNSLIISINLRFMQYDRYERRRDTSPHRDYDNYQHNRSNNRSRSRYERHSSRRHRSSNSRSSSNSERVSKKKVK